MERIGDGKRPSILVKKKGAGCVSLFIVAAIKLQKGGPSLPQMFVTSKSSNMAIPPRSLRISSMIDNW